MKLWVIAALVIPSVLLVQGCATSSSPSITFEPDCNPCVSIDRFYDTLEEVEAICGKGNAGCCKQIGAVHFIHAIKDQCVIDHENDHKYRGAFHGNLNVTCEVRAMEN